MYTVTAGWDISDPLSLHFLFSGLERVHRSKACGSSTCHLSIGEPEVREAGDSETPAGTGCPGNAL